MARTYTTQEIAQALDGELIGDGSITVTRLSHPADIRSATDLALAMEPKLLQLLAGTPVRAAIVAANAEIPDDVLASRIVIKRPRLAMAKITALFDEPVALVSGIHPTAVIEPGAILGKNVAVGAQAFIGAGTRIGDNSVIHPQVYIAPNAEIGEGALIHSGARIGTRVYIGARSIIHFNASIGADGFSFVTPQKGSVETAKAGSSGAVTATNDQLIRIASLGAVIIGDDVEIGANTSIDRGTIAATRIGNGTKIDNQVQIGHNVVIGENCLICGRVGIAGSCVIGNRVVLGGAVGIADHVNVGDDAMAMAMSGIAGNVLPRTIVGGLPAAPRERMMENYYNISRIKHLVKKVEILTARLDALEPSSKKE